MKLRMGQLLVILGIFFQKFNLEKENKETEDFKNMEKNLGDLLSKSNLNSVEYYIILFSVIFTPHSQYYKEFLLNCITDPLIKAPIEAKALMSIAISIIEKYITDKEEINKFISQITVQCTNNVCSVRGYGQFFLSQFKEMGLINENYLSQSFLNFLTSNPQIQKFFVKFVDKYKDYVSLLSNLTTLNLLGTNYDELENEIVPKDFNAEFKAISDEFLSFENKDYNTASINWKFFVESQNMGEKEKEFVEDFQKKYRPIELDLYHNRARKRLDIIVVASLIEKLPNLGGLARTCEIFNIGALTIPSAAIVNDQNFLATASSAEKWMPLIEVSVPHLKDFILAYKKFGYIILGLEQTQNSIEIRNFKFKEKTILVLGNEKSGIPQDIINLIDNCIIIPQYGEIRSLNVHVSAAIMIWEVVNSILNG